MEKNNSSSSNAKINLILFKYFKYLNLAFAVIIIGAGYLYILKPKYQSTVRNIQAELDSMQADLDDRNRYLQNLIELERAYYAIGDSDREKANGILPDEQNDEELLRKLEAIVRANGSLLSSLSVKDEVAGANNASKTMMAGKSADLQKRVGSISVELKVDSANYSVFKRLLAMIENSVRLMDVQEVDFDPGKMTASLKITTYYIKS